MAKKTIRYEPEIESDADTPASLFTEDEAPVQPVAPSTIPEGFKLDPNDNGDAHAKGAGGSYVVIDGTHRRIIPV